MIKYLSTVGLIACSWCIPAIAADLAPNTVILEIDGAKLTLADLETKHPAALFQARNSYFEAQKKAAEEFAGEYLLERQAAKENLTVAKLLEKHVSIAGTKEPTEEALRVYYEGIDVNEPFEAVREKILDAIRTRRLAKVRTAYLASLREHATITVKMSSPRAEISLKDTPVRGRADAPVMLVEYADYECPYCQQIQPALDKLATEYGAKLAVAFKDVPLPMHANAQKASEASHCAGAQGKYWEYHDLLFTGKQYEMSKLKDNARTLKLDSAAFDRCLDSGSQADPVKTHLAEAQGLGLPGTPGFFINGRFLTGSMTYEILRQVVEEELRAMPAAAIKQHTGAGANQ